MSDQAHPTARFRIYCRVRGLDPERARPGSDYVTWIRHHRREFGSYAADDSGAFERWLYDRYPITAAQAELMTSAELIAIIVRARSSGGAREH